MERTRIEVTYVKIEFFLFTFLGVWINCTILCYRNWSGCVHPTIWNYGHLSMSKCMVVGLESHVVMGLKTNVVIGRQSIVLIERGSSLTDLSHKHSLLIALRCPILISGSRLICSGGCGRHKWWTKDTLWEWNW